LALSSSTASSSQANTDAVIADLTNLASLAQQYYRKPTALGGGGNTFTGWTIPTSLDTTGNGNYTATVTATDVTLVGNGNEKGTVDATKNVKVTMTVGANSISKTVIDQ
jgi:hypothetical protein